MEQLIQELQNSLGKDGLFLREPMNEHTTFRVGGPADYFLMPQSGEELRECIRILQKYEIPFLIIGNGSNLLERIDLILQK